MPSTRAKGANMTISRAAAAVAAGGLVLGAWAIAALARPQERASAHRYTPRVVAIDRFSHRVTTYPFVLRGSNTTVSAGIQVVKLPACRHLVGAAVETAADRTARGRARRYS